jgi:hypothetical protein
MPALGARVGSRTNEALPPMLRPSWHELGRAAICRALADPGQAADSGARARPGAGLQRALTAGIFAVVLLYDRRLDPAAIMPGMNFVATVRYWNPEKASGLAVVDVPGEVVTMLGGLKQVRVRCTINGTEFVSNTMPAGGGKLALSVSQAMLKAGGVGVGQEATFHVLGRDDRARS